MKQITNILPSLKTTHLLNSTKDYGFTDLKNIPFMYRDVFKKLI